MGINSKFDPTLTNALLRPSSGEWGAIGEGISKLGSLADAHQTKKKKNILFDNALKDRDTKNSQSAILFDNNQTDFTVKHDRIKEKVSDNAKLAKLMNRSGTDFDTFIARNGAFATPTAVKTAKDFLNKNKQMATSEETKRIWSDISANRNYYKSGSFDIGTATDDISAKVRRGEIDGDVAAKIIDSMHHTGGYGIYAKKPIASAVGGNSRSGKVAEDKLLIEGKKALLKRAMKITDPIKQRETIANIGKVGSMEDLGVLGGIIQEADTQARITIDKKKASQKYADQVGNFLASSQQLEGLINDYNPEFTGMLDTAQENTLQGTDFADPNYTAYKKKLGNIFLDFKTLNNMGANFTKSEQEMMRNAMPNLNSSDAEYGRDMIEFTKLLRNKVNSKIRGLKLGNYETGELKKVTDYYDELAKKAEAKFGNAQTSKHQPTSTIIDTSQMIAL